MISAKPTSLRTLALALFTIFTTFYLLRQPLPARHPTALSLTPALTHSQRSSTPHGSTHRGSTKPPSIAKVSMLYGEHNEHYDLYSQAVDTHIRHAERHGYPVYVLRKGIMQDNGYWNKPAYMLALVIQELAKPEDERVEWLMWFDADSVLLNPALPLSIFLPPASMSHIHFLATKDHNGLNSGMFFIRVDPWSIDFLTQTIAFPSYNPNLDLGVSMDQMAMSYLLNNSYFEAHALFMPRPWFNAYEFHHGFEGHQGDLLVHFPGLEADRWDHMRGWIQVVGDRRKKKAWEVQPSNTEYPSKVVAYWSMIRDAYAVLREAERKLESMPGSAARHDFVNRVEGLRRAIAREADREAAVWEGLTAVKEGLGM